MKLNHIERNLLTKDKSRNQIRKYIIIFVHCLVIKQQAKDSMNSKDWSTNKRLLVLVIVLMTGSIPVTGQIFNFKNYTVEDGISQSNANDIIQDRRGYLWFATQKGICRFDGAKFINLTEREGLVSNIAQTLMEDMEGRLWIGTIKGLSIYDRYNFKNLTRDDGLIDNVIFDIHEDRNHDFWICTGKGVSIYDGEKFRNLVIDSTASVVTSIYEDQKGLIYLGTNKGIYTYQFGEFTKLNINPKIDQQYISDLIIDTDENLWIATHNGLFQYKEERIRSYDVSNGLPDNKVEDILIDANNNLWIATDGRGIARFDGNQFVKFDQKNGLTNSSVLSLYEDNEKNIWLGGRSGITRYNPRNPFVHYVFNERLAETDFFGMIQDQNGGYWFTTYGDGIVHYDGNKASFFSEADGIGDNRFFSVTEISNGDLWFSTASAGITRYDGSRFENFNAANGFGNHRVFNVMEDTLGNIWMGTQNEGVFKYDGEKFTNYTTAHGLSSNIILDVFEDKNKNLWFANVGGGISCYIPDFELDTGYIKTYSENDGYKPTFTRCITADNAGNLWFGTASEGVIRMTTDEKGQVEFINFNEDAGLLSENVYSLLFDRNNNLWVGTEKGVDKILFTENYDIKRIKSYRKEDGFWGVETTLNGVMEDQKGNIWFGTISGLTKYLPEFDQPNLIEPKVHLRNIKLFYEDINWNQYTDSISYNNLPFNLELPYDKDHLTFDFIGICLSNPSKVRYQFILEGLDKSWSPVTENHEVVYSNIPPGSYTFKVRASNDDGLWNENPVVYSFMIAPPFWREPWFLVLGSLLLFGTVAGSIKWRFHELKEAKDRLERKVAERTSEIQQQNDQIREQKESLEKIKSEIENKNHDITSSINYAQRIQTAMLPTLERMKASFNDIFIFYRPKDIVSGDFYWFYEKGDRTILAAVDCTGHGVPGAFMALVGDAQLSQVITRNHVSSPSEILSNLNYSIRSTLHQTDADNYDGMDVSLCVIDRKKKKLKFSGAKNNLLYFSKEKMNLIKGDRYSIGGYQSEFGPVSYSDHLVPYSKDTTFYIFTDGYQDQFGGEKNKKFLFRRLKELLSDIYHLPLAQQEQILAEEFEKWKNGQEQVDDILIIGFRI